MWLNCIRVRHLHWLEQFSIYEMAFTEIYTKGSLMTRQFSYQFHTLVFNQPIYACGFGDERCLESLVFLVLNRIIFNFPLKRRNFLICCFYFNFVCSFPPCYKQQSGRRFVAPSRPRIFFPRNEVRHPSSKSTLKLVLGYKVSAWLQIYTDKCPGG